MRALLIHLVAYWGYLWCVFFLAGFAGLRALHRFVPRPMTSYRTADIMWFGLAMVTWLGLIASLSMPLTDRFHVAVVGALCVYAWVDRRAVVAFFAKHTDAGRRHGRSLGWRMMLAAGLGAVVVLFVAMGANGFPTVYDTLLYHAQSVRWLKEFGTVPGLANLQSRIGFNNSWLVTAAFLDAGPFTFKSFHVINSFVYVVTLVTLSVRLVHGLGGPIRFSRLFDLIMLCPLLTYRFQINSLSTDVGSALATIAVISHFLHRYDTGGGAPRDFCWAAVVVPFAMTIKLANVPLVLLPILSFAAAEREFGSFKTLGWVRRAAGYAGLAGLMFLPWLVRGYFLSGYLLYPFHALDLFSPDWKVPQAVVALEQDWVRSWARLPGIDPAKVLGNGIGYWFGTWLGNSQPMMDCLLCCLVVGLVVAVVFMDPVRRHLARVWPVFLTVVAAIVYWFIQAPATRFAYGYLVGFQALIATLVLMIALETVAERGRLVLGTVFITSLAIFLHTELGKDFRKHQGFLYQELTDYPRPALRPYRFPSGLTVAVPVEGDLCINEPPLCSTGVGVEHYDLSLRGDSLADGFRMRPIEAHPPPPDQSL